MNIKHVYWSHAGRVVADAFAHDGKVQAWFRRIIDAMEGMSPVKQHKTSSELMSFLGRLANPAELGARFGRHVPLTAYGDAGLGMKTAPQFSDLLRLMADFHHQIVPLMSYSYSETKTEGRLVVGFRAPIDREGEVLLASWAATQLEWEIRRWTGRSGNIKKLKLNPSSKTYESVYLKHLLLLPETHHDSNTIVFDRAILDLPNPTADRDAYESVVAAFRARDELQRAGTALRVRDLVMSNIGAPRAFEALAKSLGLTPRQLRAALKRENHSYQEILRACRVEYASALFKNPELSVSQVAQRLGYSDPSAFTHSFVRWTGKSPLAYRAETLANPGSQSNP